MKTIYHNIRIPLFIAALLIAQGCVNLKPTESTARFYVLGAQEHAPTQSANTLSSGISIGVRRIHLAAYLDTPYIVLRHGMNQVTFSENHRWGEDLEKAIGRTIETHLNDHEAIRRVDIAPWPINTSYDYVLQINILQFEGQTDALPGDDLSRMQENHKVQVHLVADWEIIDPASNDVIFQKKTDVLLGGWRENIYANLVAGLDVTLQAMADDIASSLEDL